MIALLLAQLGGTQEEIYRLHRFGTWTFGDVRRIRVVGPFLFLAKEDGVKILNLITLQDSVKGVKLPEYITNERPTDMAYYQRTMYVAFNTRDNPEIDVVDFSTGELKMSLPTGGSIVSIEVGSHYLFVLTSLGIEIYNLSNPTEPKEAGNVPFSGFTGTTMKVFFPYIYVSAGKDGLFIFKVEGSRIKQVYHYQPPDGSPVIDAETYGNYVFLACAKEGIKVINTANGDNPLVAEVKTEKPIFKLRRYKKYLLGMFGSDGLKIYSIGNPSSPNVSAYYTNGQYLYDAGASGKYVILAYGPSGIITLKAPFFK
ncbi:MAG: hypothetical protein GXO39_01790 [Thermotogae bacterium]|nr:hypothetical protein [Thermotogota bacterium]